jgi:hypothetical protein
MELGAVTVVVGSTVDDGAGTDEGGTVDAGVSVAAGVPPSRAERRRMPGTPARTRTPAAMRTGVTTATPGRADRPPRDGHST